MVLTELHGGHPGITCMKALARQLVWWLNLDCAIKDLVKNCEECQQSRATSPPAPLYPWQWPTQPWRRIHIDFAGPVEGQMLLVIIDTHSKWIEVFSMKNVTSSGTIRYLRQLFTQFGIPETIVSDNSTQFTSTDFKEFCRLNGIQHVQIAPYHPSSNGLTERAVQVIKQGISKQSTGTLNDQISRVLFQYRITPHSTTGVSPAELVMGRRLRSRLDLLKPSIEQTVTNKQLQRKEVYDRHCRHHTFKTGEKVFMKNQNKGKKWLAGSIIKETGPVSYQVKLGDGRVMRCHQDQLRPRFTRDNIESQGIPLLDDDDLTMFTSAPSPTVPPDIEVTNTNAERRYPSRVNRPPIRYREGHS